MKKAVISLSGGMDSTCLLMELLSNDYEVKAYSFDYGQKHKIELEKVQNNIKFLQDKGFRVTHQIINLRDVFSDSNSALHEGGGEIPHEHYAVENQKVTVVENRNVIFSSIIYGKALAWANKLNEHVCITLGIHSGDHCIYRDCRPESQEAAEHLYKISNWGSEKVDYIAPFVKINKSEVLKHGVDAMRNLNFTDDEVNFILKNTHTCYDVNENGESCGECGSCRERLEAFEENHMKDPVLYRK